MKTRYLNADDRGDIAHFLTASTPDDGPEMQAIQRRCLANWEAGRLTLETLAYVQVWMEAIWAKEGRRATARIKAQHGAFKRRLEAEIAAFRQVGGHEPGDSKP